MASRLAMVTGASSGIGEAFVRGLAERGYALILVARRRERLEALARELTSTSVDLIVADLATDDGVAEVARRLELGGVNVFVNNAGIGHRGQVAEQPVESLRRMLRLNLETPMLLSRAALRPMLAVRQGVLINVVSMSAFQAVPYLASYAATKAGLLSFTEGLAEEVRESGVRVQALCPGNIPTEFQEVAGTRGSRFDRTPAMSAHEVARRSLQEAFGRGRILVIPGWRDRLAVMGQRLLPRSVPRRVAASLMRPE